MQFSDILHDINDKILQEFQIVCMKNRLKYGVFSLQYIINDINNIIDDIEQLCHKPDGLLVIDNDH